RAATPARELAGIDFGHAPALTGYLRTKSKPTAEVLLETAHHEPLLARWRYGLGQVVAFTSDATTRWATRWIVERWPGFNKLWSQIVRGTQRPRQRHDLTLTLHNRHETLTLEAEAIEAGGRFLQHLDVRATVIDGARQSHEVALRQVGPGRYATELIVPA